MSFTGYSRLSYEESRTMPFHIYFKRAGFPKMCADWCEENCVGKWGWYFEENGTTVRDVHIGFEHQMDMYWGERFGEIF